MTTKTCPNCGNTSLVLIRTQSIKLCPCGAKIPWPLDEGQKPVVEGGRMVPVKEVE